APVLTLPTTYNEPAATGISNTAFVIKRTETNLGITPGAQYLMQAQVAGVSKFVIANTGSVGVGTTGPTQKLEVAGNIKSGGVIMSQDLTMANNTAGNLLVANGAGYTPKAITGDVTIDSLGVTKVNSFTGTSTGAASVAITNDVSSNATMNLVWSSGTSGNQSLKVSSTGIIYNPSTGNLGVGNTSPLAGLHVGTGGTPVVVGVNDVYIQNDLEVGGTVTAAKFYGDGSGLSGVGGLTWIDVIGTTQNMAVNRGYIADNASLVTMTLPATATVGSVMAVTGGVTAVNGWNIAERGANHSFWFDKYNSWSHWFCFQQWPV
ncbi:MAG: hypothetical protein HQL26_11180, partial [Candidatus Omnitrophica bacterium]|nr:hypothetical protein [Candidatus Omnitrophota bacterium]